MCITNCTHSMLRTASDKEYDFSWPPRPLMPKRPYKRHVSRLSYQAGASEKLNSNNTIEMTDKKQKKVKTKKNNNSNNSYK